MSFFTPSQIEEIARRVRHAHGFSEEELIDISRLAEAAGLHVYEADFGSDDITGKIEGTNIYVNKNDSEPRKRFTIAHELAHYILHQNGEINHVDYRRARDYYTEEDLKKEVQANMLAASLLMPEKVVRNTWDFLHDIDDLAKKFRVSKKAAAVRLDSLGLIE